MTHFRPVTMGFAALSAGLLALLALLTLLALLVAGTSRPAPSAAWSRPTAAGRRAFRSTGRSS